MRGIVAGSITLLTMWANFQHIQLPSDLLTQWGDSVIAFVQSAAVLISAAMTAWGLCRKLWTTFEGTNAVVNDHPAFNPEPTPAQ